MQPIDDDSVLATSYSITLNRAKRATSSQG